MRNGRRSDVIWFTRPRGIRQRAVAKGRSATWHAKDPIAVSRDPFLEVLPGGRFNCRSVHHSRRATEATNCAKRMLRRHQLDEAGWQRGAGRFESCRSTMPVTSATGIVLGNRRPRKCPEILARSWGSVGHRATLGSPVARPEGRHAERRSHALPMNKCQSAAPQGPTYANTRA